MSIRQIQRALPVRTFQLEELGQVHGVACGAPGELWFGCGDGLLVRLEAASGRVLRRYEGLDAQAGTTFDGRHVWQITSERIVRIDPDSGEVLSSLPVPAGVHCSGMAFADGALWIGDFDGRALVKVDAQSGAILKRVESDRLITGVAWTEGALWHGGWQRPEAPVEASLRRVDPETGAVLEELALGDWSVSGLDADAEGRFWCGGSFDGGLRAVRRP